MPTVNGNDVGSIMKNGIAIAKTNQAISDGEHEQTVDGVALTILSQEVFTDKSGDEQTEREDQASPEEQGPRRQAEWQDGASDTDRGPGDRACDRHGEEATPGEFDPLLIEW